MAELEPEKQQMYCQKYRVEKLTKEEIQIVEKEIEDKEKMKRIGKQYFESLDKTIF